MKTIPLFVPTVAVVLALAGCEGNHEAEVRLAREASDRQAAQNVVIAKQNQEIATTTKRLVEADKELIGLQKGVQVQQDKANEQRDVIETERKEIATQRLRESTLGPIIEWSGIVLVIALVLAYCSCLVYGLRSEDGSQQVLNDMLLQQLTDAPLPSLPTQPRVIDVKQLRGPTTPARRSRST